MALEISKIKLPSGNEYALRDDAARDLINDLAGATSMLGKTTTTIVDGVTSNPVVSINGTNVTAFNGDMVISNDGMKEFIWTATEYSYWQKETISFTHYQYTKINSPSQAQKDEAFYVHHTEAESLATQTTPLDEPWAGGAAYIKVDYTGLWYQFGDLSTLGALAYKDSATVAKGSGDMVLGENTTFTNSAPTTSLTAATGTPGDGEVGVVEEIAATGSTVPSGSTEVTKVVIANAVSKATAVTSVSPTTTKYVTEKIKTVMAAPTDPSQVTVSAKYLVKTTVPNVTSVGSASTWNFNVSNGVLQITGANSTAPTLGTAIGVATGALSTTATGNGDNVSSGIASNAVQGLAALKPQDSGGEVTVITNSAAVGEQAGVTVVTGVSAPTDSLFMKADTNPITVGTIYKTKKKVSAGTSTPTITVGTNDKVKVAKYDDITTAS